MKWCNDIYRQFLLSTVQTIIQLACVGIILIVIVKANFPVLYNVIEHNLFQFTGYISRFDLSILDLLFDVLLFVSEIFILLAITLNVGLLFQEIERFLHIFTQPRQVLIEIVQHQHAQVTQRRLKLFYVFNEK